MYFSLKILSLSCLASLSFILTSVEATSLRPMNYEDIVNLEKPKIVSMAPDGSKVAFVVQRSNLEENRNYDTVYLWHAKEDRQETLWELDKVQKIQWQGNDTLYVQGQEADLYKILVLNNAKKSTLLSSVVPFSVFTSSADGTQLYYTQTIYTPEATVKKLNEEGYVYRWGSDTALTILEKECGHREWDEVWSLDISSGQNTFITRLSYENWVSYFDLIKDLKLSEEGSLLAITAQRLGRNDLGEHTWTQDLLVWDVVNSKMHQLLPEEFSRKSLPCWIGPRQLVFQEANEQKHMRKLCLWDAEFKTYSNLEFFQPNKAVVSLAWNQEHKEIVAECDKTLYRLCLDSKQVDKIQVPSTFFRPGNEASTFSYDLNLTALSSILEDVNTPPQVIIYDFKKEKTTLISALNPALKEISCAPVQEIIVETKDGISTTGYLVHPLHEEPGVRYPLIIATYGFNGQVFIADGQLHSSFPAQPLAAEGYFVLLLNHNGMGQFLLGAPKKAREIEGWSVLKTFERAVDMLEEKGLVDPQKIGLYGWSHGAFMVEFLISHSNKFQVACVGEGGDYNPSGYWFTGMKSWPSIYNNMFDGPPWGSTLQNYLDYSPFFQVDQIQTPLLLEFSEFSVLGLEMYVPLRSLGIPAELVLYHGEEHNFEKPKARVASMKRKLEWFNYWLLDERCSKEPEQYARWDEMRADMPK